MKRRQAIFLPLLTFALIFSSTLGLLLSHPIIRGRAASTLTVTSTADNGAGSLRQAIADAQAGDSINFNLSYPATIILTSGELLIDKNLMIAGPGAALLTVKRDSNASEFRIFEVSSGQTVNLSGLRISGGSATDGGDLITSSGGGILNQGTLSVNDSVLSDNFTRGFGGGIFNQDTLSVNNSTISGNSAVEAGGGIVNNFNGTITINNSTISGNSTTNAGGIENNGGTLNVNNSTFSGNSALMCGGIENSGSGTLTINNSTLAGNSATFGVGGGIVNFSSGGKLTLNSSIVANNTAGSAQDISGPVTSGDYNLIRDAAGILGSLPGTHNLIGVDPMLGPLAFNGGQTQTQALLAGSPAIDHGINALALTTDQRGPGFARTYDNPDVRNRKGDGTDIGAFEVQKLFITGVATSGKNLLIIGAGFVEGADILIDGEKRKTVFESATSLIGKKAAKGLASGAKIKVRNPDGSESNEVIFQ